MNLKRVRAIAHKEYVQIIRDPRSLALGLLIPVILIVLFGYALSLDIKEVPLAIWDQDNTKASVDFLLNFKNSDYFKIIGYYDNYRALEHLLNYGETMMAMVIPKDFDRSIFGHFGNSAEIKRISATTLLDSYCFYKYSRNHDVRLYGPHFRAWLCQRHTRFSYHFGGYIRILAL